MSKPKATCPKCGSGMERGYLRLRGGPVATGGLGLVGVQVEFELGPKTSMNPFTAFTQGLNDRPGERAHDLSEMSGYHCGTCNCITFYPV